MGPVSATRLRIPQSLTATAVKMTMLASLACHSEVAAPPADASADAPQDVATDACPLGGGCASTRDGAVCPQEVCTEAECPTDAGCVFI
jgi:hypothetical protein